MVESLLKKSVRYIKKRDQLQQQHMIHFIEEVLQVYVHDVVISLMDVLMRLLYGLVRIAIGSEAIAVCCKVHFKLGTYHLAYPLL